MLQKLLSSVFIFILTQIKIVSPYCGSYPVLTEIQTFGRDRGSKKEGAFDFPCNT